MQTVAVDIPEEVLTLLKNSRLGELPVAKQVSVALAIHLLQEGVISVGKAAELSDQTRAILELLLGEMGIPPVRYDVADYQQDREALERAQQNRG